MGEEYSIKDIEKLNIAERVKKQSANLGISYCTIKDENYPLDLQELSDRPAVLYYKGEIAVINAYKNIAVIGSRGCSSTGRELAYKTG